MGNLKKILALLAILTLLSSCGYSLSKTGGAGPMAGAHNVSIPLFYNDTFEPLVEKEFTAALKDEILRDGRWVLTDREGADMEVTGRVTRVDLQPLSYDPDERILEYRVRTRAEVKLTDLKTNKVVWKDNAMDSFADYRVTGDVTKSKIRKGEAIKKAAKDFAEEFIIKVLDVF